MTAQGRRRAAAVVGETSAQVAKYVPKNAVCCVDLVRARSLHEPSELVDDEGQTRAGA